MTILADRPARDPLFERLARGEPAALEEVCRRYGERVAAIARRRLGRSLRARLETADVAQEAMVDILKGAGGQVFRCEADFLRWVRVVVEHKIVHIARRWRAARRGIAREQRLSDTRPSLDPKAERPSQVFERREAMDRLSVGLAALRPRDRAVIISRLLLKLPWSQVAQSLGASVGAAQMRFVRARQRLACLMS